MSPRNELGLPPAPPLPADVRDRALRAVLDGKERAGRGRTATRGRYPRWGPLLTAAAVVLVAVTVATVLAVRGAGPDQAPAVTVGTSDPAFTPAPRDDLPPPSGDPDTDDALARCATAVVENGLAEDYPPAGTWRASPVVEVGTLLDQARVISDAFVCVLRPDGVAVTDPGGPSAGGVRVVWVNSRAVALLNPQRHRFTIGAPQQTVPDRTGALEVYAFPEGVRLDQVRITVQGEDGYDGKLPQPTPYRVLPDRDQPTLRPDTPEGAELAACIDLLPDGLDPWPELWVPVGRHDVGGTAPPALVARISDRYAGFCVQDPSGGPTFAAGALPVPGDRPEVVVRYRGGGAGVLLTVPAGVGRMEVTAVTGPATDPAACTIADGLAACTLDDQVASGADGRTVVVTAFSAADPGGTEVYRG